MAMWQQNFEPYWSRRDVHEGLQRGILIKGPIEIKNFRDAYVPHPDGEGDVYIKGRKDRNRALNSDIVVVEIYPNDKSKSDFEDDERTRQSSKHDVSGTSASSASKKPKFVQRTGKVVYIAEQKHSGAACGHIKLMANKNTNKAWFTPTDSRLPRIVIFKRDCPRNFFERPSACTNTLYIARIQRWDERSSNPNGTLERCLGEAGQIEPERLKAILSERGIEECPVSQQNFEPYWSQEDVDDGIESGSLIQGRIKISQRNSWTAFVPHPDGKTDVYIEGYIDRNRALNTDVVVVLIYPHEKWRVYMSDFEDYERSLLPSNAGQGDETCRKGGVAESSTGAVGAAMGKLDISSGKVSDRMSQVKHKGQKTLSNRESSPTNEKSHDRGKICSVSDMIKSGSPLAKDLFGNGPVYQTHQSWDKFVHRTGKVVYIAEKKHSRTASGQITLMGDNKKKANFSPSDSRMPRMLISMEDWSKDFLRRPQENTLYIAHIEEWDENFMKPQGKLTKCLGKAGQIKPETEAMLVDMGVDDSPFSEEVNQCIPPTDPPWQIPRREFEYRKDLRKSCVFTIDPPTARNLNDAISIEELPDGKYSVGVHITDVSFFVKEDTALDKVAAERAASVYLEQEVVIPMLPLRLCEDLASLHPDQDRLAFSVIWTISENGKIYNEWCGRSVIRSCVKLSYDHAQIAINLRKQRIGNGAFILRDRDRLWLRYEVDTETGIPKKCFVYKQRDSDSLVEEFILRANMAVANRIKASYPDKAILIQQPSPQEVVEKLFDSLGLYINATTSGNLQRSLQKHHGEDEYSQAKFQVIVALLSKRMSKSKYFCSGAFPDESLHHHFALNVPQYTQFTNPIRRYTNVLVHRLLAASLGYCSPPRLSTEQLQRQADYCNYRELIASMTSKHSSDMYFTFFVKEAGGLEMTGMVMAVLENSFDVLLLKLGVIKRVFLKNLPLVSSKFRKNMKCPELVIEWAADEKCDHQTKHLITIFTEVDCYVFVDKDQEPLRSYTRPQCDIRRPKEEIECMPGDDDDYNNS